MIQTTASPPLSPPYHEMLGARFYHPRTMIFRYFPGEWTLSEVRAQGGIWYQWQKVPA